MELYTKMDFDPVEFIRLGQAIGTWIGPQNQIVTGRDGRPVSRYVRRLIATGVASTGASVLDMRLIPGLVVAFEVKRQAMRLGLYASYNQEINVQLFDGEGQELEERSIEEIAGILSSGRFYRASLSGLGTISYYPNGIDDFINHVEERISFTRPMRVIVDCQCTPISVLIEDLLSRYGVRASLFNEMVSGYGTPRPHEEFISALKDGTYNLGIKATDWEFQLYSSSGELLYRSGDMVDLLRQIRDQ